MGMTLHPYQQAAITKAAAVLKEERGFLLNDPMGLGKTVEAIRLVDKYVRIVVVCPAIARKTWENELDKWWPEHPPVTLVTTREQAWKVQVNGIVVLSYALLPYLNRELTHLDAIIFDEIHYLQQETTKRYRAANWLVGNNVPAVKLGLTGTIFTNKVASMWAPTTILFPSLLVGDTLVHRFGSRFAFSNYYMEGEHNGYGWEFQGVREDHLEELKERLSAISARVALEEVAHLLPPFITNVNYVEETVKDAAAWGANTYENGGTVCILTHFRKTVKDVAAKVKALLKKNGAAALVQQITGAEPPEKRHQLLKEVEEKGGVLVATMHSLNTSINLTWVSAAAFAELPQRTDSLGQALGRFYRLNGTPTNITVLASPENSKQAVLLAGRIKALAKVIKCGNFENAIVDITMDIRNEGKTEEEMQATLRQAALDWEEMEI